MRLLCLHGRGSNNEVFELQTAPFRAELDDFTWDFVQGTILHTEGNWSLHTSTFSKLPLYTYYDPLSPTSILQSENELLRIVEEEGPFDGVLGYSGGAAIAAQTIIRDLKEHPLRSPHERPFRFAIFINGASPLYAFKLKNESILEGNIDPSPMVQEAADLLLRPSAVRRKDIGNDDEQPDRDCIKKTLDLVEGKRLADGTPFITNGVYGLTRYNALHEDTLIDIPTLHIRSPIEEARHHGLHLYRMCDSSKASEFYHKYGHDFPRGHKEMKKIAQLIREVAENS